MASLHFNFLMYGIMETCLWDQLQSTTAEYISDLSLGYKHKSLALLLSLALPGFIIIH